MLICVQQRTCSHSQHHLMAVNHDSLCVCLTVHNTHSLSFTVSETGPSLPATSPTWASASGPNLFSQLTSFGSDGALQGPASTDQQPSWPRSVAFLHQHQHQQPNQGQSLIHSTLQPSNQGLLGMANSVEGVLGCASSAAGGPQREDGFGSMASVQSLHSISADGLTVREGVAMSV